MNEIKKLQIMLEKKIDEKNELIDIEKFTKSHCIIYTIISVLLLSTPVIFTFEFLVELVLQILSLISLMYLGVSIYQFADTNKKMSKCDNSIKKISNAIEKEKELSKVKDNNDLNMSKDVIKDKINSLNNLKETIIITNEKEDLSKIKILKK